MIVCTVVDMCYVQHCAYRDLFRLQYTFSWMYYSVPFSLKSVYIATLKWGVNPNEILAIYGFNTKQHYNYIYISTFNQVLLSPKEYGSWGQEQYVYGFYHSSYKNDQL